MGLPFLQRLAQCACLGLGIFIVGVLGIERPANAVIFASGSADGIELDVTALLNVTVGPVPTVSNLGTSTFNSTDSLALAQVHTLASVLGVADLNLEIATGTDVFSVETDYDSGTGLVDSTSSVDNLSLRLVLDQAGILPDIVMLELTATLIEANAQADATPFSSAGSTTLEDLVVSGTLIGPTITLAGITTPAANTILINVPGVLNITLNAQALATGLTSASASTTAIDISLLGAGIPVIGGLVNGNIAINTANAMVNDVPEPGTLSLLAGGVAAGIVLRRRRKAA